MNKKLSVVVSVYNEEEALPLFYGAVRPVLEEIAWDYELLFVNDGSADESLARIRSFARENPKVKCVSFSRNFGHEAAMIAGIDYATGDALVCMDADLQHPPQCIPKIVEKMEEGYGVVTMVRTQNRSAGIVKNITSAGFYWVINHLADVSLEPGASDFFALSKRAADVLRKNYREKVRFLRGYVQSIGFRRTKIEYEAADRAAGVSKYSIRKLFTFSMNTIYCFSNLPLKLGLFASGFTALLGVILIVCTLFTSKGAPGGFAAVAILICFLFAVLFLITGIIGEYLAIMLTEIKDRPVYIVEETEGFQKY